MITWLRITPLDAVIARDGRPFGVNAGHHMYSLDWLYPSTVCGAFRTLLGKLNGGKFSPDTVNRLKSVGFCGPFVSINKQLYFHAPSDALVKEVTHDKGQIVPVRPTELKEGEGCNLPEGLLPVMLPDDESDFKPSARAPRFWSFGIISRWLRSAQGEPFEINLELTEQKNPVLQEGFYSGPEKEIRMHVKILPDSGAAAVEEEALFSTTALRFGPQVHMVARVTSIGDFEELLDGLDQVHPLGGERRLAHWQTFSSDNYNCPNELARLLGKSKRVRLLLATPAIFDEGWKPGWLNENLEGSPPGVPQVKLKLIAACIGRWKPISGWSLEQGKTGPKPVRRLVPAGARFTFSNCRKEMPNYSRKNSGWVAFLTPSRTGKMVSELPYGEFSKEETRNE